MSHCFEQLSLTCSSSLPWADSEALEQGQQERHPSWSSLEGGEEEDQEEEEEEEVNEEEVIEEESYISEGEGG